MVLVHLIWVPPVKMAKKRKTPKAPCLSVLPAAVFFLSKSFLLLWAAS